MTEEASKVHKEVGSLVHIYRAAGGNPCIASFLVGGELGLMEG